MVRPIGRIGLEMVYVGIGANLGDPVQQCRVAMDLLDAIPGCEIDGSSSLYTTQPWGDLDQNWFVNAVVRIKTSRQPFDFLHECLKIEVTLGKNPIRRWGPRKMDLDILLWETRIIVSKLLMIPHPFLQLRRFVLQPLCEIDPELPHPLLGDRMIDLLQNLSDPMQVILLHEKERR